MFSLTSLFYVLPFATALAAWFSSFPVVQKLAFLPLLMGLLLIVATVIGNRCEGNGFETPYMNCDPEFLNNFANQISLALILNYIALLWVLPLALALLGFAEWKSRR